MSLENDVKHWLSEIQHSFNLVEEKWCWVKVFEFGGQLHGFSVYGGNKPGSSYGYVDENTNIQLLAFKLLNKVRVATITEIKKTAS